MLTTVSPAYLGIKYETLQVFVYWLVIEFLMQDVEYDSLHGSDEAIPLPRPSQELYVISLCYVKVTRINAIFRFGIKLNYSKVNSSTLACTKFRTIIFQESTLLEFNHTLLERNLVS